jgi:hypothetical protein
MPNGYNLQGSIACARNIVYGQIKLVDVSTGQLIDSKNSSPSFGDFEFNLPLDTPYTQVKLVFDGNSQAAACESAAIQIPHENTPAP